MIAEIAFWSSIGFVLYTYAGYPAALSILSLCRTRPVRKGATRSNVSVIVTAYNEDKWILEKIENILRQDYPRERLEIIVASDCSTDRTDEIAASYVRYGVRLVRAATRLGKEGAQRLAVERARGDLLVFSDVATMLAPNGISTIVSNFHDPSVGCVSSVDTLVDGDGRVSGEGAYVRYEMLLRRLETRVGSVVGLSGSFFAARRIVCRDWIADLPSDFATLLGAVKLGLRGVSDPEALGYYSTLADPCKEYERKVRTVTRGIRAVLRNRSMLNPFRYGLFAWQLVSHKLCRWSVPFALTGALVANAWLARGSGQYRALFAAQVALYGIGAAACIGESLREQRLLRIVWFFLAANLSIVHAWLHVARGRRFETWTPSER